MPLRIERLGTRLDDVSIQKAWRACREIRQVVFSDEQGVSLDLEFDGLDDEAEHFLAWDRDGAAETPVATARLRWIDGTAKAERVAVLASQRGRGVGRALMDAIETRAIEQGRSSVHLHAQVAVIPFYERLGYEASGAVFVEADIEHRSMTKDLRNPSE